MKLEDYINSRLALYNEAFDIYLEQGVMPKGIPAGDLLGRYLKSVVDANPQLLCQDYTWREVLKDDLLAFLQKMLMDFVEIERDHQREIEFIRLYQRSDINTQRELWPKVYNILKYHYSTTDVNIDGYVKQFRDYTPQDVIDSIVADWLRAADGKMGRKEWRLLCSKKDVWERHVRECGNADYRRRKSIENVAFRFPALRDIVEIIGREKQERKDEEDDITYKYVPILVSKPVTTIEVEQVSTGDDLSHIMPTETAILAEPSTEMLFYKKLAEKQLQIFANRPPLIAQEKTEQEHKTKPRLEMGPIIVSIDTSGSMQGYPEKIAKSILMQLLRMAKRKKRKCFVITFSVRAHTLELTHPANWRKVDEFLTDTFCGGTDGEEMLRSAMKALETDDFGMADVLIISDFEFGEPTLETFNNMNIHHAKGTRFYGLRIGKGWSDESNQAYESILDKTWKVLDT